MQARVKCVAVSVVTFVLTVFTAALAPAMAHAEDATPPAPPADVRADATFTNVTISWDASADDSGWVIYTVELTAPGDSHRLASTETAKTFGKGVDHPLIQGATYAVTVWAKDAAGNVSRPAEGAFTVPADRTPPAAPADLRFENTAGPIPGEIVWDASLDNQDEVIYTLYKEDAQHGGDDGLYQIFRTADTHVSVRELNDLYMVFPGDTMTLRVVATDIGGNDSPPSAPLTRTFEF